MSPISLFSVLSLISMSSSLVLPDKISVLLCKDKCKSYGGCTSVRIDSKHLQCELIFGTENTTHTWEQGIRLFKVQDGNKSGCGRNERVINNKRGSLKCVKVASAAHCERVTKKKERCREAATVKADQDDEGSSCILIKRENITVKPTVQLIELPMVIKPGMKLSVYGGTLRKVGTSRFSLTTAPENPSNPFKWFHINIRWTLRKLSFSEGVKTSKHYYDGNFPISDKTHFTLTIELTQAEMKISADETPLTNNSTTIPLISMIKEFNVNRYSTIHRYVIQKTGENCEKMNSGIP